LQVIEIPNLNEHLLSECDSAQIQQCARCGEPIPLPAYPEHIKKQTCNAKRPETEALRCPLCHQDLAPDADAWKLHLLQQGCPQNPRTQ